MLTVDSRFIYALLCLNLMRLLFESSDSGSIPHLASLTKSHSRKVSQQSVALDDNEERIDWIDWVTHARTSKLLYTQNRSVIKKKKERENRSNSNPKSESSHLASPKGGTKYLSTIKRGTVICNMHMHIRDQSLSQHVSTATAASPLAISFCTALRRTTLSPTFTSPQYAGRNQSDMMVCKREHFRF